MKILRLSWVWLLLTVTAPVVAASAPAAVEAPAATKKTEIRAMEESIRRRINEVRREYELPPLAVRADLGRLARDYSRRMAREDFFDHYDPGGGSMVDRLKGAGVAYRTAGENIFRCRNVPDPVQAAIDGWMASPPHRQIILHPEMRETGVGVAEKGGMFYFTQMFIRAP